MAALPGDAFVTTKMLPREAGYALCWRLRANTDPDAGFEMYPDSIQGTRYVMGWCGQAEAAG